MINTLFAYGLRYLDLGLCGLASFSSALSRARCFLSLFPSITFHLDRDFCHLMIILYCNLFFFCSIEISIFYSHNNNAKSTLALIITWHRPQHQHQQSKKIPVIFEFHKKLFEKDTIFILIIGNLEWCNGFRLPCQANTFPSNGKV